MAVVVTVSGVSVQETSVEDPIIVEHPDTVTLAAGASLVLAVQMYYPAGLPLDPISVVVDSTVIWDRQTLIT